MSWEAYEEPCHLFSWPPSLGQDELKEIKLLLILARTSHILIRQIQFYREKITNLRFLHCNYFKFKLFIVLYSVAKFSSHWGIDTGQYRHHKSLQNSFKDYELPCAVARKKSCFFRTHTHLYALTHVTLCYACVCKYAWVAYLHTHVSDTVIICGLF